MSARSKTRSREASGKKALFPMVKGIALPTVVTTPDSNNVEGGYELGVRHELRVRAPDDLSRTCT